MAMKTPGVYIVEKNAFPNSVVEVATAVPAFIGYTEKAMNGGTSLARKPMRISSMAEYERYFGGPPRPKFSLKRLSDKDPVSAAEAAWTKSPEKMAVDAAKAELDKVSSDGSDEAAKTTAQDKLKKAQDALAASQVQKDFNEAQTKAKSKDPVSKAQEALDGSDEKKAVDAAQKALDAADENGKAAAKKALEAAQKALADSQKQKDLDKAKTRAAAEAEFKTALGKALVDKLPDPAGLVDAPAQSASFGVGEATYLLERPAGREGGRYLMYQAMRHFFQNGGGPCYIVSVGSYDDAVAAGGESKGLVGGITPLLKEQEPTMVLTPDAVLLPRAECAIVQAAVLKHCGLDTRSRFAILDVWGGEHDRAYEQGSVIDHFREDVGINHLKFGAAYYPWLHSSLVQVGDVDQSAFSGDAAGNLVNLITEELQLNGADDNDQNVKDRHALLKDAGLDDDGWLKKLTEEIETANKSDKEKALKQLQDKAVQQAAIAVRRRLVHEALLVVSPLYKKTMEELRRLMNLMPPSAAMAGLYTMVDNTRGVWKAPANISVAGVIKPAVEISAADQEDLNVTTAGKSINAIRSFIGEGALVWGARTLDGNSLDWRYINVRRTMIFLEESCRLASKAMVFEPNVANTWVTIKSMIANFLTSIWRRGGLAGAVPDDAFSVHCGLGETMTPEDILEGILRVTVLVAMVRPAEFIEITFQQQMQKS